jgi:hypothetical protein
MIIRWLPGHTAAAPEINSSGSAHVLLYIDGGHCSAERGNGDRRTAMINSLCPLDGKKCLLDGKKCRRRRPGRVPIVTAIITAVGAVAAAVVAGVFRLLG